ncbi:MAG: hypothetical protein HXX12_08510 [Geothrix sp.]|uniref:hypothetical protein n=1 Tax=Geothrix sp. TaxID=1962974 RepID=UPI00182108A4|nr:hypothetical protein [Geothrix sp.]NWJ40999.1 hypothetical protein [Geothrix sp.]WIL21004.1 MAG: hypothetical protein QOZ81_000247 [Geothrix sp.]
MHLVLPWFLPLATLVAWLGLRTARDLRAESGAGRKNAVWMLVLMFFPLFVWLMAQFTTHPGGLS